MQSSDPYRLTPPTIFLVRMAVFLTLVGFLAFILHRQITIAFLANPGLNGVILGVELFGIVLAVAQVARLSPAIDLLVCVTDVIAVGAILECQRRGIAVPGQLGVCGFDDLPIAAAINPALTTIGVDRVGMGRTAGQVLLQRLGGAAAMSGSVDVGFDIRERASTRSEISAPGEGATKELRE